MAQELTLPQWTAIEDVKHRTWRLRDAVERYEKLSSSIYQSMTGATNIYTPEWQEKWSERDGLLEAILDAGTHFYKALKSNDLPADFKDNVGQLIDPDTRQRVKVVRNLRTHWEENRRFWSEDARSPIPSDPRYWSARWYREHFPDANPWSSGSWQTEGHVICGIVSLGKLKDEVGKVEAALEPFQEVA